MKEEYDTGHVKGAEFLNPYAFSKEGLIDFLEKSKNKKIIFYCRVGLRSRSIVNLLKDWSFESYYIENGGIFIEKNLWEGDYYNYSGLKTKILTKKEMEEYITKNTALLDPRNTEEYQKNHISSAINMPIAQWGRNKSRDFFKKNLSHRENFIGICYDKLSCFKAKLVLTAIKDYEKYNIIGLYPIQENIN